MTLKHSCLKRPAQFSMLIVLVSLHAGCSLPHRIDITQTGAPRYDRIDITYEIRGGQGTLASRALQPIQTAAASENASSPEHSPGSWSKAQLRIQYPHPESSSSHLARATLRLSRRSHSDQDNSLESSRNPGTIAEDSSPTFKDLIWNGLTWITPGIELNPQKLSDLSTNSSTLDDELWALDLPKHELDLLLVDLANNGFFDQQTRPRGDVRLAIQIDRGHTSKAWSDEPRLDDMLVHVYRDGWIEGFVDADGSNSWLSFWPF